jgi:hypothetical protein
VADPQDLRERIVGALGAVVAVALVIGVILGVLTYTAVHLTGLDDGSPGAGSKPAGHQPSAQPTATDVHNSSPSPTATPSPTHASPSPTHQPKQQAHKHERARHHHHRAHRQGSLTLSASPQRVSSMGRIDLHGRYPGHGGASLAVQRLEGGQWQSFPVSTTVRGGRYSTWVASGRHGPNRFRVVDGGAGNVSPAVTVIIG